MIELACETDFVAKGEDFQTLAADIVTHLANAEKYEATQGANDPAALAARLLADNPQGRPDGRREHRRRRGHHRREARTASGRQTVRAGCDLPAPQGL